ncbi:hypothetical protein FGG08_007307 [Glutinoglossum americanum]|uniref:Heterokaryon incompatibility domain-containing protein n=1 Tax=Glutinoglossum americanum TaxID=1670608 RepID=A0A9P8I5M9_9PEZI|nr:hypothetical protein FGG08_007307 [Glutinoglossum americanum]
METTDWESTYCYDILDYSSPRIRLLTLFPAKDKSANIQCSLETVSLPLKEREYEALSYTWGDISNKHRLFIGKDILKISQNLYIALCHLRHQLEPRNLWVDAVCINQASDQEKNHQVRQMHDIYSSASKVLIWLGKSDKDIEQAMEFLQDSKEIRDEREKPLVGLRKMFSSPWWSRMWVVQEVVVARTEPLVICGNMCAPWEAVNTTLLQISWNQLDANGEDRFLTNPKTLLHFTLLRSEMISNARKKNTLESLLKATCDREASDPRDHVYALLGLIPDPRNELFEADYTESEVLAYQNAMVSVFKSREDLDWLVYALGGDPSVKPSWCVDFSMKTWMQDATDRGWEPTAIENRRRDAAGAGATTGREELEILHDPGNGTIKLVGTEIGHIDGAHMSTCGELSAKRRASGSLSSEEISSAMNDGITKLFNDIGVFTIYAHPALKKRLGPDEACKKLAAGDIWKVAAGGISFDELIRKLKDVKSYPNGYPLLEKFVQKTSKIRQIMSHEWADLLPEEPADFATTAYGAYLRIAYLAGDRCFFTTDSGYIGRAGHLVQKGDVLCILFGCRLPAVLRPQEDGSYKLVTLTYTHDVMEGEFLRNNGSLEEKEFLLR